MTVKPLLDFIARFESRGDYDIVWGGIKRHHRPQKPLTSMTIAEVLAWQDNIDSQYMSEAAGRYQIMEDTLRGLYGSAGLSLSDRFDARNQDRLGEALLRRRGLQKYLAGQMSAEDFCNSLAKEWASLPVVTGPNKGRSYYAGDGLNAAHAPVDEFVRVVGECRQPAAKPDLGPIPRIPTDDHPKDSTSPPVAVIAIGAAILGIVAILALS